jgi:pimeloyl-ACP methyl ester carboxylesterase
MGGFTTTDGRRLEYATSGDGPVLVCHPGGPGFSSRYFADLSGLADVRNLVLLDPRGTGGSSPAPDPSGYDIEHYVADVEELRLHLGLERFELLGHSHGGVVAMAYTAAHPDRVERLVLASTLAAFDPAAVGAMEEAIAARSGEPWFADAFEALTAEQEGRFGSPDELAALVVRELPFYFAHYGEAEQAWVVGMGEELPCADALRHFNEEVFATFDLRDRLGAITAPTLVVTGDADFITGPLLAREIASRIPGAELVLLPGSGHFLFIERPAVFHDLVAGFLSG